MTEIFKIQKTTFPLLVALAVTGSLSAQDGPFPADAWPASADGTKLVHFGSTDFLLAPLGAGWEESLTFRAGGDHSTEDVLIGGFDGKKVTGNHLNIADSLFEDWADQASIDILVQVYGNEAVLGADGAPRDFTLLTGTLGNPDRRYFPVGGSIPLEGRNSQWNWVLFQIDNPTPEGSGGPHVGFVPPTAVGGIQNGGINGGTIRFENVPGLTVRAVAFGEQGAFGTPEQINRFFEGGDCSPEPDTNHAYADINSGESEHLVVLNSVGQTSSIADGIGPADDQRRAVRAEGSILNFAITDDYLGEGCVDPRTVKICVEYYDDPAMAGSYFGPDSYATDDQGGTGLVDFSSWALIRGTGEWVRQSFTVSNVSLFGIGTAPLTGGPRLGFDPGSNIYISRYDIAVMRTGNHVLAGLDPLADCFADLAVCAGDYGFEAELDLEAGVFEGLSTGRSGGDQEMIEEKVGPEGDKRMAVRGAHGDGTAGANLDNYLNFAITDEVFGPSGQPNATLGICVTYWDNPAVQGAFFRPQVYKSKQGSQLRFMQVPTTANVVIEGTNTWKEAYFEISDINFSGVNQAPQAAARFLTSDKIHFTRVRYGVIRDCGPTAGMNPLEECKNPVVAVPIGITGIELDDVLGDVTIMWNSVVGKTYRVQESSDLKTWSDLLGDYPVGGAISESTLLTTPRAGGDGPYYLRVMEE